MMAGPSPPESVKLMDCPLTSAIGIGPACHLRRVGRAAADLGALLCDGIGDLVSLGGFGAPDRTVSLAYRILQGARLRTSWTEFISCPSCGRTQFDLEEATARVKERTEHLPGVKIAVMGCVVNGPGESKQANIGISLPGTFEEPKAPVYVDGQHATTLRGEGLVDEFKEILLDYVKSRYGAGVASGV